MKSKGLLCALAAAGMSFAFVANSQESKSAPANGKEEVDPFDPKARGEVVSKPVPVQAQVQVEFVEMSHEALTQLLFLAKPTTADATPLRQKVQEMVAKKEAKVLETQIVIVRNKQKATTEAVHEFIFPTEYEQPPLGCNGSGEVKEPWNVRPVPTAFETRNMGSILEVDPEIETGNRTMFLRFIPELVWHTGNTSWHQNKDDLGTPVDVQMPDFYTIRLNTAIHCISGQYTLAGVVSPKDDKGNTDLTRKVMVFVKCDVLEVK
jgi:hypothetical protein